MRTFRILILIVAIVAPLLAQQNANDGPANDKAQKTYKEGQDYLHRRMKDAALEAFKKADKQDGGRCRSCEKKMIEYGVEMRDWKVAETGAEELVAQAQSNRDIALAHYQFGIVLAREGQERHKDELLSRAHDEFTKALSAASKFPQAVFADGQILARLNQDDAAKARFQEFLAMTPEDDPDHERASRFISEPELARALMAPAFVLTTTDGQRIAMDDLAGKVVLIDFWATWCGPCREALPHMRDIAKKFQGQPLVVLSVSLDNDEGKWKDFVVKNEMTWPQYRDGGFNGPIAKLFGVEAIPHTFTIDADGILQDERIGDASIEGKLKKLIARAEKVQATPRQAQQTAAGAAAQH
jgi:thiol-disulfide isomerase/thioredoxin